VVTLSDVAHLAGVSTATVSHVINNSKPVTAGTRVRVERAIAKLGFVPNAVARDLARQRTSGFQASQLVSLARRRSEINVTTTAPLAVQITSPRGMSGVTRATARSMLRILRAAQPISRVDLARRLDVNRSTVTEIVKPLIASGVLREGAPDEVGSHRLGRPAVGLSLCAESDYFIGVNIGVRRTQVGAAAADDQLLGAEAFDTSPDPLVTLKQIDSIIERLRAANRERTLLSIGVSVPGPTDALRKRLLFAPHLGWRDVPVAAELHSCRRLPIIVENDATAAAMYEARRRLRQGVNEATDDFILVRAGTGIGVGLVLGGEVYRGAGRDRGLLGEFGHMTIVAGGKACACGNRGCWERYASAASASSLYAGDRFQIRGEAPPRFVEVVARAEAGELRARATLERVGEFLGIGIGNVISGLGVSRVVVSGRVVHGWSFIKQPLRNAVAGSMAGRLANWSIECGAASGSGLGGALEVAIEQHLTYLAGRVKAA
jgi:predicted NBD/HSP70 family sugar kinase